MFSILAIESSCDETAVAIIKDDKLLCNVISSQIEVHQKYGGVMPEIASRLHLENIGVVLKEALDKASMKIQDIDAIAFTRGPGLIGALHIGLQAAKTIALFYNKPLIPVHHLVGHIYANEFITNFEFPMLCIVVSGGNTEFVIMNKDLDFNIIGETLDDAVGECFDKVARVLDLPYPGGVYIDKKAKEGEHKFLFKSPHADGYNFSYSGLKTSVINEVNKLKMKNIPYKVEDVAKSFQDVAIDIIVEKAKKAAKEYNVKMICLAGGVSANSYLRQEMSKAFENSNIKLILPPIWCTTDNAAMIAKAGVHLYKAKVLANLDIGVDPNWKIEDFNNF